MSMDLSDTAGDVHEGVIVEQRASEEVVPYASADEANRALTDGLVAIRDGMISARQGQELLEQARARKAWEILGYDSWQACLSDRAQGVFRTVWELDARTELVARLRKGNATTRQIAKALGTAPSTASRDVVRAREAGLLENEPERVEGADGKVRDTRRPGEPRRDLSKTFRAAAEIVETKVRTLGACLEDDRWRSHREGLAPYRHDLRRSYETLGRLLAELDEAAG